MYNNTLISIIIPVYNSEKYLNRCINSVISQTYNNWELILVNDGSCDKSGFICNQYAKSDNRINVIHTKNKGVSKARNIGIDKASGEWITFSDSDDEMFPNTLENYNVAINDDIDIIRGGFERIKNGNSSIISTKYLVTANKEEVLRICSESYYEGYIWNSCFRNETIKKIRFKEDISWCEDHLFTFTAIKNARKVVFIPNIIYRYYAPNTNYISFGTNLSSRYIEPQMIIKGAIEEMQIKKSCISHNSIQYKKLITNEFYYKIKLAIRYAIIDNRYLEAFKITHKYLNNQFKIFFTYIFSIKIIPFINKIIKK